MADEPRGDGPPAWARILVGVALAVLLFVGWRTFLFVCDDGYIVFRFASNHVKGWGFTWNPPPFRPVDGYTNFLWLVLVRLTWGATGVEPPTSAPWISLACGALTLVCAARILADLPLPARLERQRFALGALALLGTVTNRTFLAWLSSGLGTALFNLCLTWWAMHALTPRARRGPSWTAGLALSASLLAMTRPDGALFWAATWLLIGLHVLRQAPGARRGAATGALFLCLEPLYLLWHVRTYGELLPNTFYAKQVSAWPASGLRYAASFVVENGLWLWLLLVLAWLGRAALRGPRAWLGSMVERPGVWIVIALLVFHFGYYTLAIGGDHFEFRVYSHLILFSFVSAVALVGRLDLRPRAALGSLVLFVLVSWPIPWTHWAGTHDVDGWPEAESLTYPVAPRFPAFLRPLLRPYDAWQAWLIDHFVCMRHQEHKVFAQASLERYPSREEGARRRWDDGHPVLPATGIGVPAWVLPEVAIIDLLGLNDRIIARHPVPQGKKRLIAHDRAPPKGYVKAYRPNVVFGPDGRVFVRPRQHPLTDERIREIEAGGWNRPGDE